MEVGNAFFFLIFSSFFFLVIILSYLEPSVFRQVFHNATNIFQEAWHQVLLICIFLPDTLCHWQDYDYPSLLPLLRCSGLNLVSSLLIQLSRLEGLRVFWMLAISHWRQSFQTKSLYKFKSYWVLISSFADCQTEKIFNMFERKQILFFRMLTYFPFLLLTGLFI